MRKLYENVYIFYSQKRIFSTEIIHENTVSDNCFTKARNLKLYFSLPRIREFKNMKHFDILVIYSLIYFWTKSNDVFNTIISVFTDL